MPNPNWAIYARSSVANGDPGMQVEICRQFVRDKKGIVEKVFTDPGEVEDSDDREGLARMLQGARNGAFKYLVVLKPDRICQDKDKLANVLGDLHEAGIVVWSVKGKKRLKIARIAATETADDVEANDSEDDE